ncbi:unnamed protein product, partial [Nesidiocoris tenuis]
MFLTVKSSRPPSSWVKTSKLVLYGQQRICPCGPPVITAKSPLIIAISQAHWSVVPLVVLLPTGIASIL